MDGFKEERRRESSGSFTGMFRKLDAYAKVDSDFYTKTIGGGVITLLATAAIVVLLVAELSIYSQVTRVHELEVDTSTGETIKIHVNVTFPRMPCSWLSLDAMDVSGELHLDVDDHVVHKQRLSPDGHPLTEAEQHNIHETKRQVFDHHDNSSCMSCYGAESYVGHCCNTCDQVRAAYRSKGWALGNADHIEQCASDTYLESVREQKGEGCKIWGHLEVNKVAGNFHFAPGRSYQQFGMHIHDVAPFENDTMDFSHSIHMLAFGDPFPGLHNPLDGVEISQGFSLDGMKIVGMYQYFVKVVPTMFTPLAAGPDKGVNTNQYSVTDHFKEAVEEKGRSGSSQLPGLFFFYDLSPIKVRISEQKRSFVHFVTNVCATVGGVFTVSGIIDAFVYQSARVIHKKKDIGKLG